MSSQWTQPPSSRTQVNKAATRLVRNGLLYAGKEQDLALVRTWRGAHAFPLNTVQVGVRQRVARLGLDGFVAQRLKTINAIYKKLQRQSMRLTQMVDIGGARLILPTEADVRRFVDDMDGSLAGGAMALACVKRLDLVRAPRPDGYRSIHMHLEYQSRDGRRTDFDRLLVELQIRTPLQHAWATMIESLGMLLGQDYKGGAGPDDHGRWLTAVSGVLARMEGLPLPSDLPTDSRQLARLVAELEQRTGLLEVLRGAAGRRDSADDLDAGLDDYYLIEARDRGWSVEPASSDSAEAVAAYDRLEGDPSPESPRPVLVGGANWESIRRSFASYRQDVAEFVDAIDRFQASPDIFRDEVA